MLVLPRSVGKQPAQRRSREAVQAIVEAARQLITAEGFRATSTTRVAERAGVSVGSLYQYFPDKHAILTAIAREVMARNLAFFEAAEAEIAGRPLATGVRTLVRALADFGARTPHALRRQIVSHLPPACDGGDAAIYERYLAAADRFLLRYGAPASAAARGFSRVTLVNALSGMLDGTARADACVLTDPDYVRHVERGVLGLVRGVLK